MLAAARLILAIALLAHTAPATAQDKPIDWKKGGEWSALTAHIGTYNYDKVLADKRVKAELDKLLKGHDLDLNAQLAVHGPINFENDCLIMKGNEQHKGDISRAYVEVCTAQGNINIALYDSRKITVFTKLGDYQYLNPGMREWIYLQSIPMADLEKKPVDLQIVTQAD